MAALIALEAGVISPAMQTGAVLMALITTAMTGPLVDRFAPRVAGAFPPISDREAGAPAADEVAVRPAAAAAS